MKENELHFKYDPKNLDVSVLRLSSLLEGREDTEERRDLYKIHDEKSSLDWTVIQQDNLLYPQWCIEELRILRKKYPIVYQQVIDAGTNYME